MHPIVSASSKVECMNKLLHREYSRWPSYMHLIISASSKVECMNELLHREYSRWPSYMHINKLLRKEYTN